MKCLEAKHDPALAKRAQRPVAADAAGPSKPAEKPAANSAAGQIAGIMAGTACIQQYRSSLASQPQPLANSLASIHSK